MGRHPEARYRDFSRYARRRTGVEVGRSFARRRFGFGAAAVAAALAASGAAAAPVRSGAGLPAWAGRGFLAFTCERGGLCVARPGKRHVRPLDQSGPFPQWDPAISPDGKAVAFRGYWAPGADGAYALYVVGTNGCTPRRLTRDIASNPSWSPDGRWIAFDGGIGMWKVRSDGTGLTRLGGGRFRQWTSPSWSPRGNEIAFVRLVNGSGGQIWLMRANGSRPVMLRAAARVSYQEPSWSKDGKRIAFVAVSVGPGGVVVGRPSWIEVMNADGSHVHVVTSKRGSAWNPVWLPGDTGIAWLAGDSYTRTGSIFAARADGTHVRRVLRAQAEEFAWSGAALPRRGCS